MTSIVYMSWLTQQSAKKLCESFLVLLLGLVCLNCAETSQEKKILRVGILCGVQSLSGAVASFKTEMATLGFVAGDNINYVVYETNFDREQYRNILRRFIEDRVDLIFVYPSEASMEAKLLTEGSGIPVVFAVANTEGTGLVKSVRHPGGNITGIRYPGPDIAVKRFEILLELLPDIKKVLVPYQRGYPIISRQLEVLIPVAITKGVSLVELPAKDAVELEAQFRQREKAGVVGDAILFLAEPLSVSQDAFQAIGTFAAAHKLPTGGVIMLNEQHETLFGVNIDLDETGRKAASLAEKILTGSTAGELPVLSSENILRINYKKAREMGIDVPEGLLRRAHEIIR